MRARRDPFPVTRLKKLARPLLLPLLQRLGLRRGQVVRVPRISLSDRLSEADVPSRVSVRPDQTILLNGLPFFPVGIYYVRDELSDTTGAGLRKLREMGFNIVFFDGGLESESQLDLIWDAGLHVWYRPPGELYREFDLLKRVVSKFARHPAVLFWEMDDEPILNGTKFSDVEIGCRVVRSIDPHHPILCNQWLPSRGQAGEIREWARLADIYGFGIYPVPAWRWGKRMSLVEEGLPHSVAIVGRHTELWKAYAPGKPILPVLQAWAWDCVTDGEAAYPNYSECRFMAYQAVINGAKGLHHYGAVESQRPNFACGIPPRVHEDLDQTHADFLTAQSYNRWFWNYYAKVVAEISRMSPVFVSRDAGWTPSIKATPPRRAVAGSVECLVKRYLDSDLILLVNASESPVAVEVGAARMSHQALTSWGRGSSITVNSEGFFRDDLEPFGVRVYAAQPDLLADFSDLIAPGDEDGIYDCAP